MRVYLILKVFVPITAAPRSIRLTVGNYGNANNQVVVNS